MPELYSSIATWSSYRGPYFLNKDKNILSLDVSSCMRSEAAEAGGVGMLGVPGLELEKDGAGEVCAGVDVEEPDAMVSGGLGRLLFCGIGGRQSQPACRRRSTDGGVLIWFFKTQSRLVQSFY